MSHLHNFILLKTFLHKNSKAIFFRLMCHWALTVDISSLGFVKRKKILKEGKKLAVSFDEY